MTSKMALATQVDVVVRSSIGAVFGAMGERAKQLEQISKQATVLKSSIREAIRLQSEWKKAHDRGSDAAGFMLKRLEANLSSLRNQGVQVRNLGKEYKALTREAKAIDLRARGYQQIAQVKPQLKSGIDQGTGVVRALAIPTMISADFQAIIRNTALKAGVANTPQEAQMARTVVQTSQATGMARNDVANLVASMLNAGMTLDKALDFTPLAALFAQGQGASGEDTAKLIRALQVKAGVNDAGSMRTALEGMAAQGQAGGFDTAQMARFFPQLLGALTANGKTDLNGVRQIGALLQVRMNTASSTDEAANDVRDLLQATASGDKPKAVEMARKVGVVQNQALYAQSLHAPASASGVLDQHLAIRRQGSSQKWNEAAGAVDDAMRSVGDAIRPMTDSVAVGITAVALAFTSLSDNAQGVVAGITALVASLALLKTASAGFKLAKGMTNIARGAIKGATISSELPDASPAGRRGSIARVAGMTGKLKTLGRVVPGISLAAAVVGGADTFQNAQTREQKAEGYGKAGGALAGAAIGSLVMPGIGTAVGAMAGEWLGGWLSKHLFGGADESKGATKTDKNVPTAIAPGDVTRALVAAAPTDQALSPVARPAASPPPVTQQITFAPNMPITVQGSVTDPTQLATNIEPIIRRQFLELTRQASMRQLADPTYV